MTPAELTITVDAYVAEQTAALKQALTVAYMGAAWQRAKKMPRLETILNRIESTTQRKKKKAQTPQEMMAIFKTLAG